MEKQQILIVEDEVKLARFVELELKHEGYEVDVAHDGDTGFSCFESNTYDLILMDLMLPGINGLELTRRIRKTSEIPIIMLTARGEVMDKVAGLDMGADDYVTKPFAIEEVLARMRVALKKHRKDEEVLETGGVVMDLKARTVRYDKHEVELTKTEFDLLAYLMSNKDIVLTREQILNKVWGYDYFGETNIVDVYIRYLRSKIDDRFGIKLIYTARGVGYIVKTPE